MRTDAPMFTCAAEAAAWHRPLPADHIILAGERGYWAAAAEVQDAVEAQTLRDLDPDDDSITEQARKAAGDAVNNAWSEGITHDEWVSAALRLLGHGEAA